MKGLNTFVLISLIFSNAYTRIYQPNPPKIHRSRLAASVAVPPIRQLAQNRSTKLKAVAPRKLLSAFNFAAGSGALSLLIRKFAKKKTKKYVNKLKNELEMQRLLIAHKSEQKANLLQELGRHMDEIESKVEEMQETLKARISDYNTYVKSKLRAFGVKPVSRLSLATTTGSVAGGSVGRE